MAFTEGHVLLTAHGTLGVPIVEDWTFGVRVRSAIVLNEADLRAFAQAAWDPVASMFMASSTKPAALTHVKAAWIQIDGHYPPGTAAGEYAPAAPLDASAAVRSMPFQASLAISLGTNTSRGHASKGRFYLPLPKYAIDADGRMAAADAMAMATLAKSFMNGIKVIGGGPFKPAVFSQAPALPGPAVHDVTFVRVGRVVDTIRSRRRKLIEDYQKQLL